MAGQPITLTLPTVGDAGPGYATKLLTALTALETELERKVVPADMDISTNLSFLSGSTNYAATGVKYLQLALQDESVLTAAGFPMSVFVGSTDGELYFNDNSGRQVQLTTDGSVNVSTSGGITGSGYGSGGVELRWDAGDGEFEARSGDGTDDYADLKAGGLLLSDGSSNFVRVAAPTLASDYTLTLPTAVAAGAGYLVTLNTSGAMGSTNTPSVATLTTSGAVVVGSTLAVTTNATVTGTLAVTSTTALADTLTMATGKNVVLQGTGKVVHGNRVKVIPGIAFQRSGSTGARNSDGTLTGVSGQNYYLPLSAYFPAGTQITSMVWKATHSSNSGARNYDVKYMAATGGSPTTIESDSDSTESGSVTVNSTVDIDMLDTRMYWLDWDPASSDLLISVTINYNTPA